MDKLLPLEEQQYSGYYTLEQEEASTSWQPFCCLSSSSIPINPCVTFQIHGWGLSLVTIDLSLHVLLFLLLNSHVNLPFSWITPIFSRTLTLSLRELWSLSQWKGKTPGSVNERAMWEIAWECFQHNNQSNEEATTEIVLCVRANGRERIHALNCIRN